MEWMPMETAPTDGRAIVVRLSNGSERRAEYWDGPDGKSDGGGWAVELTQSFIEGVMRDDADAEMVGWKPAEPTEPRTLPK